MGKLCERYDLRRDDGTPLEPALYHFRHSLGAHLAALGVNKEALRRVLRHAKWETTQTYYIGQSLAQLSHNVVDALTVEARRLAMAYRTPVAELAIEAPDVARAVADDPDRVFEFGICMTPKTTEFLHESCVRAATCLSCTWLVPELRKKAAFVQERDLFLHLADQATDARIKEQRRTHAAMAQAYVLLCDDAEVRATHGTPPPAPTRRKSYTKAPEEKDA